jgi:hypothetical protein
MRYDATELMAGVTEVLCYGTAVVVVPVDDNGGKIMRFGTKFCISLFVLGALIALVQCGLW